MFLLEFPPEIVDQVFDSLFANSWMLYEVGFKDVLDIRLVCKIFDSQVRRCALANLGVVDEEEYSLIEDHNNKKLTLLFLKEVAKVPRRRLGTYFFSSIWDLAEALVTSDVTAHDNKETLIEDYEEKLLLVAVEYLETYKIIDMIKSAPRPITCIAKKNSNLLSAAASVRHTSLVQSLLSSGTDPDSRSEFLGLPMYAAAIQGHADIVELLIKSGAHIIARNGNIGPMGCVGFSTYPERLVSVLYVAARFNHEAVVRKLLENGARIMDYRNPSRKTALQYARDEGVVKALLEFGADLMATDCDGITALDFLKLMGKGVKHWNIDGF